MEVNYYIPGKIASIAKIIWEQNSASEQQWQILPSGYIELIFNLGEKIKNVKGKFVSNSFNPTENLCFLSGLHTKPLYLNFSNFHVMGIQLEPVAARAVFDLPCSELIDWAVPGDALNIQLEEIENKLLGLPCFKTRARWLEEFLLKKINENNDLHEALKINSIMKTAVFHKKSAYRFCINDYTGYSRMHTYRLFKNWFGLSPSSFVLLSQFTGAINDMHQNKKHLTNIGLNEGFYDQAHFIRIFRRFANITPGQYLRSKTNIPGQLPYY